MVKHEDYKETRGGAAEASSMAPLINTGEAAGLLGIGKRTVQELMAARKLPYLRIGRSVRFRMEDITAFIEGQMVQRKGWKGGGGQ